MEQLKHRNPFVSMICILLACMLSLTAAAEDTAAVSDYETVPEGTYSDAEIADELICHRLWGFFTGRHAQGPEPVRGRMEE